MKACMLSLSRSACSGVVSVQDLFGRGSSGVPWVGTLLLGVSSGLLGTDGVVTVSLVSSGIHGVVTVCCAGVSCARPVWRLKTWQGGPCGCCVSATRRLSPSALALEAPVLYRIPKSYCCISRPYLASLPFSARVVITYLRA